MVRSDQHGHEARRLAEQGVQEVHVRRQAPVEVFEPDAQGVEVGVGPLEMLLLPVALPFGGDPRSGIAMRA